MGIEWQDFQVHAAWDNSSDVVSWSTSNTADPAHPQSSKGITPAAAQFYPPGHLNWGETSHP